MDNLEVIFYDLPDGSFPAMEFVDSLPFKLSAKTYRTIGLIVTNILAGRCDHDI